jgi:hypothetical protein
MSITYAWNFPVFDVAKTDDGLTDVVKTIHWIYLATDGTYTASNYGTVGLGAPNPADFIPYDQLTEAWAISACSASLDVPAMNVSLAANIANQINPPIVPMNPPFQQAAE